MTQWFKKKKKDQHDHIVYKEYLAPKYREFDTLYGLRLMNLKIIKVAETLCFDVNVSQFSIVHKRKFIK